MTAPVALIIEVYCNIMYLPHAIQHTPAGSSLSGVKVGEAEAASLIHVNHHLAEHHDQRYQSTISHYQDMATVFQIFAVLEYLETKQDLNLHAF